MDNAPLFDRDAALERLDGDAELLDEVVGIYREDAPQILGNLETAISARDARTAEREAHSLKGSSANIGAIRLQQASLIAEKTAHQDPVDWSSLEAQLPGLKSLLQETVGVLAKAS